MQSSSQAGQDIFPQVMLRTIKDVKTYLDLGCHHPTYLNNSYALELAGWSGLCMDIRDFCNEHREYRKNPFKQEDLTTIEWEPIIQTHFPTRNIDYISFDVDEATIPAFERFPFSSVRFKTMTIEHDGYRLGNETRDKLREALTSYGYTLLCADVICEGFGAFEDWWVDMTQVDPIAASILRFNNTPSQVIKNTAISLMNMERLSVESSDNLEPITYVSGGLLGDFIHQLSVVYENFINTGRKARLCISDKVGDRFRMGAEHTYKDIFPVISRLPYIDSFEIHTDQSYNINLSAWRSFTPNLYSKSWQEIYSQYHVNWGAHPWIFGCTLKPEFENTILISTTQSRLARNVDWKVFLESFSYPVVFLENPNTSDYNDFTSRTGVVLPKYTAKDFTDFVDSIFSCKKFIGTLSMPLALADALKKDRLAIVEHGTPDGFIGIKSNPSYYP